MRQWSKLFQDLVRNYPPNLPDGTLTASYLEQRQKFQDSYEKYVRTAAGAPADKSADLSPEQAELLQAKNSELRGQPIPDSPEFTAYEAAFELIPSGDLGKSRKRLFSAAQIKELAAKLFYQSDCNRIRDVT